jgi:riboflavin transporter FmnP
MEFAIAVIQSLLFGLGAGSVVLFGDAVATWALRALGFNVWTGDLVAFITAGLLVLFTFAYVVI